MVVPDSTPYISYAEQVVAKILSDDILVQFPKCQSWLKIHVTDLSDWQITLPLISCLATGGSLEDGIEIASAWYLMYLASDLFDHIEDKEFIPDDLVCSREEAINLSTALIFLSFHNLSFIESSGGVARSSAIFSDQGFGATAGQHRSLTTSPTMMSLSVNDALEEYWQTIIIKAGSVFRAGTAGGASAGTLDETIIEGLGDYGTALGVMLQLLDDGLDILKTSGEVIQAWEISLPLLLYLLATGEENIVFPAVQTRAEWHTCLRDAKIIEMFSVILLQWKARALESIQNLGLTMDEKKILENLPSLILGPIMEEGSE